MSKGRLTLAQERQIAFNRGLSVGYSNKEQEINASLAQRRNQTIVALAEAGSLLAKANASLTYSLAKLSENIK